MKKLFLALMVLSLPIGVLAAPKPSPKPKTPVTTPHTVKAPTGKVTR